MSKAAFYVYLVPFHISMLRDMDKYTDYRGYIQNKIY